MRTMDSAFNHAPLWRAEWLDADGMLIEVQLVDRPGREDLLRDWNLLSRQPSAAAFRFIPLNENTEEDCDAE